MGKWFFRGFFIIVVSFIFSYSPIDCSDGFFSGIYTVIGIMFPVALSQIMAFSFSDIENDKFVQRYRGQLSDIRFVFVVLFSIATIVFLIKSVSFKFQWKWIKFDIQFLYGIYLLFCLFYYIRNFVSLAKLKNEIEDEVRKANKDAAGS
jgi:hypothetical protein